VHVNAVGPEQVPPVQTSPCVHALPSLQAVPFGLLVGLGHPVAGTHVPGVWHWSAVHVTAAPPLHAPF